jgi:hypothetical protein
MHSLQIVWPKNFTLSSHNSHLEKLMIPKMLENNVKMFGMLFFIFRIYEDVVNEDHNEF